LFSGVADTGKKFITSAVVTSVGYTSKKFISGVIVTGDNFSAVSTTPMINLSPTTTPPVIKINRRCC
jgi:hypothetical protein